MHDWDDIRHFLAVARTGSITAAARRLAVNHSTVSRRIAQLERRMGVRLFDRLASGLALTAAGSELVPIAEQVENQVSRFSRGASARDARIGGKLTIAAPPLLAHYLLMPMIAGFSSRYPQIEVTLLASDELASLNRREADVAIRATAAPQETLVGHRLTANRNSLYCTRAYLQAKGTDAEEATRRTDLDWIWHDTGEGRPEWAASHFPGGRAACRVDTKLAAVAAALANMGVVELPVIVGAWIPDLVQLPELTVKSDRDVWILYHRDFRHTARMRVFVADIRKQFAALT
ncbi:LysR family transcriptional regulator [Oricola thermophila]|uniref:LysR family transcriptional regulator n=1 Tax=Oricola thermophila TaxID=2742145 RepID=A0A6N1VAD7_9HYPH|nr:LysR family transcriptional regulator [Oricola thermophila]QKV17513.1 LysR family transcriptional regulator [Oricola thermophila]